MSQPLARWGGSSQKIQIQDAKPLPTTCSRFGGSGVCTPISHPHPNQPSRHRAVQIWVLLCIMSVCLSFPICKIRALPVIPGVRGHHCYMQEVSSTLPQRFSHSPGVATGCGQGPWGEGSCGVTGNLLRAPKSVDSIPHLQGSTCSGTSRAPAEPISTQLHSAARSALLPFPESN